MPTIEELICQPVAQLHARFYDAQQPLPKGLLAALHCDERPTARALAKRIDARQKAVRAEAARLRRLLKFEDELRRQGFEQIAGVDEAGVGPLAGPVVASAVILPRDYKLRGLDDSKKLDEATRDELAACIKANAVAWAVGVAEVAEIDTLNIYHAGLLAMRRAVETLSIAPDYLLVDARSIPSCAIPQCGIVRGDARSLSIAAASVLAKTTRDALMLALDQQYPGYGLAGHKGYPTPEHFRALRQYGALPIHRRSFRPVREALGLEPMQNPLFNC